MFRKITSFNGLLIVVLIAIGSLLWINQKHLTKIEGVLTDIKISLRRANADGVAVRDGIKTSPVAQNQPQVTINVDGNPFKGDKDAQLTLIEFSDYQCPFCAQFFRETLPFLEKEYIQAGKLKYVLRDFPLDFHPYAKKAAGAAHCAGAQGRYWEMHDKLFENQKSLNPESIKQYAREIGLESKAFIECLDQGRYALEVQKDLEDGQKAGVDGTPAFFLGFTREDNLINTTVQISGARPIEHFKKEIESLLSQ